MPEGHAVHRLARLLTKRLAGDVVAVTSPQGRFAVAAARLDGQTLHGVDAYGKHLFLEFGEDRWVHVHLGIYGRLSVAALPVPPPVGQVRLRLVGARAWADLRGPAVCELIGGRERAIVIDRLGPDPLRPDADDALAWRRIRASRAPVAALVMDQRVVAGVGNIYRAEVLFRHGGEVYVYRRADQPCHVCGTPIVTRMLAGRRLFWCPVCQPPGSDSYRASGL